MEKKIGRRGDKEKGGNRTIRNAFSGTGLQFVSGQVSDYAFVVPVTSFVTAGGSRYFTGLFVMIAYSISLLVDDPI